LNHFILLRQYLGHLENTLESLLTCLDGKKDFEFAEELLTEPKIPDLLTDNDDPKSA